MDFSHLKPSIHKTLWWIQATPRLNISERSLDHGTRAQSSTKPEDGEASGGSGVGKFLIYEHRKDVDQAWEKIKNATEQRKLSFGAKVSTRKSKTSWKEGVPEDDYDLKHVICVYTDGTEAEKERIRTALYELGFVRHLPYKTDAATAMGEYGSTAVGRAWKPRTGACLKISKSGRQSLQITQLYPDQDPPPRVLFLKEEIGCVADSIYKVANTVPPPPLDREQRVVHNDSNLKIYGQRLDNFEGEFCFIIEANKKKVEFYQEDAIFCYNRLLWYKRTYLEMYDEFESEEEGEIDLGLEDYEWLSSDEDDNKPEAVREYIRIGQ